jgi:molybdopterin biosynthesis enzyme
MPCARPMPSRAPRCALTGAAPAGKPFSAAWSAPGEAVRIFTGGFVPEGADSILLQEDADAEDGSVRVNESGHAPAAGSAAAALDFAEGAELLPAGRRLTARDIGLAAAGNHPWLTVHRRPRIGILATGDEIALPGEPLPGAASSAPTRMRWPRWCGRRRRGDHPAHRARRPRRDRGGSPAAAASTCW